MTNEAMLDVQHLRKVYETKDRSIEAVRDLHFAVQEGELMCIVGPSGAGKTTLLKCIAGLLNPTSGEITLDGKRVQGPPEGMSVVFQEYQRSLFPWLTVEQNVALPLKEKGVSTTRRRELVAQALESVGLAGSEHAHPHQLSGGMQQRVAIARAVAYEPSILLMDEPFAAVDAQTRAELEDLVLALWERLKVTVLFVTHDIEESIYLGQRVIILTHSPTVVMEEIAVDLPADRDQLTTRSSKRFAELRSEVYGLIQDAKAGKRPDWESVSGSATVL